MSRLRSGSTLALVGSLWLAVCLLAAPPGGAVDAAPPLRFEALTTSEGLSQMTVYGIVQDRRGFLWFATQSGLNRYDGYDFEVYGHQPADPGSLSHGFVRVLHLDREGYLWVGTYGGGLNRLDPQSGRATRYRHDPDNVGSVSSDDVRALGTGPDGALWVGTRGGGLNRLERGAAQFERFRHDPRDEASLGHDDVRALQVDGDGALWVGTNGGGLSLWDPAAGTFARTRVAPRQPAGGAADQIRALLADRRGRLWVGTNDGLYQLDRDSGSFRRHPGVAGDRGGPTGPRIRSLFEDADGTLWVGTRSAGLYRVDPADGRVDRYAHDPLDPWSLSHDDVYAIYQDDAGGMWLGTFDGGVNRFDPGLEPFTHHRHQPGDPTTLGDNDVNSIQQDSSGALWIGTFGGGLDRLDPETGEFRHLRHKPRDRNSPSHDDIRVLHADPGGILWIGTMGGGLSRFDPSRKTFTHYRHDPGDPSSLSHDDVYALCTDHTGALWAGTYGGGLNRLDPASGTFERFLHDPGDPRSLGGNDIGALLVDRTNTLWVATRGGRLSRFDRRSGSFVHYRHATDDATSLSHNDVSSLFEDRAGNLWVGTYGGGLDRMDPTRSGFEHFTGGGLQRGTVQSILEDGRQRLWISTNHGLVRFDPATGRWASYDVRDGLQDDQFNSGAALRARDGRMYFGGIGGLTSFYPDRFEDNTFVPPVVVTSFRLFDSPRSLPPAPRPIELAHDENFFSFEFAALSFRRPDKNRYLYRLEGFDDGWVDPGQRRYASYTNVPPGSYVFRVKGSNNDGVWNETGARQRLVIARPWWGTTWFRAAAALTAAVLLWLAYRAVVAHSRRLEQRKAERRRAAEQARLIAELEAKNSELERFSYAVSHDLKSPLLTIRGFIRALEQDLGEGAGERVARDLQLIDGAAGQMQGLIDELLVLLRAGHHPGSPEWLPLSELAREAADLVAASIAESGVQLEIDPDLPPVWGDRGRLLEVLQNLLDNAVKYMGDQASPRVTVGVRQDGAETVVWVRDNGIGIEPSDQQRVFGLFERLGATSEGSGLGLALVKRIVEAHGGAVWVESAGRGHGSTFCFTLPSPPRAARSAGRPGGRATPAAGSAR